MREKVSSSRGPLFLAERVTELNSGHPFGSEPESECFGKRELSTRHWEPETRHFSESEVAGFVESFDTWAWEGDWFIVADEKTWRTEMTLQALK